MARPTDAPDTPRDTREQILKLASDLLRTRGFMAFSYGHIAEALGVKPAAIHYHFPSKTDLGLALIERYRARYRRWMDEAADQGLDARAQLEGYIRIATRFSEDGTKICPVGALEAELAALPEPMQAATRQLAEETHAWLVRVLEHGRKRGELRFEGSPTDVAFLVASALQGGLQMARTLGRGRLDSIVRSVRALVGA